MFSINIHKESCNIKLHNIGLLGEVFTTLPHESLYTINTKSCPPSYSTTIAIIDKCFFKIRIDFIVNKMMHNPISEISCKYFTNRGRKYDECYRSSYMIATCNNIFIKLYQSRFIIKLKNKGIVSPWFIPTAIIICLKYIFESDHRYECVYRFANTTDRVGVVLVVVVLSAIGEVLIPGVVVVVLGTRPVGGREAKHTYKSLYSSIYGITFEWISPYMNYFYWSDSCFCPNIINNISARSHFP